MVKGTEAQASRHAALSAAAQALNGKIQSLGNQRRAFLAMQDEVRSMKATKSPEMLREAQARHSSSGLDASQWDDFLLVYKGDVDAALTGYVNWADQQIAEINGIPPLPSDPSLTLIADDIDLGTVKLATIKAEMTRLEQLISADQVVRGQYAALSARIGQENSELNAIELRLTDAKGAEARRKTLQAERDATYGRVFDAIVSEQNALAELYAPLMAKLAAASGTLHKLSFSVTRIADAAAWGGMAEDHLIDCRKADHFYGRGSLINVAETELKPSWQNGNASEVQSAMTAFISSHSRDLLAHAPYVQTQQAEFRTWSKRFAHWLFDTNHISVRYEIAYDGVDIRKLSPGTRGIVLLLSSISHSTMMMHGP